MSSQLPNILQWPCGKLDFSNGTLIMGILNTTPDSFSDGGKFLNLQKAIDHAIQMAAEGAAIIDIGAESTRPGSQPVPPSEQISRAIPVIKAVVKKTALPVSIDTCSSEVAKAALDAGAAIINDITALADDEMKKLAADRKVPVVLMHMQGITSTMQIAPKYANVVEEVHTFLLQSAANAQSFGIFSQNIFIDPGIGFGKNLEHNLLLLKHIDRFVGSGYRVLLGTSRKRFIGTITGREKPEDRIFGTAATVALAAFSGVAVIRVHDVAATVDVIKIVQAIKTV